MYMLILKIIVSIIVTILIAIVGMVWRNHIKKREKEKSFLRLLKYYIQMMNTYNDPLNIDNFIFLYEDQSNFVDKEKLKISFDIYKLFPISSLKPEIGYYKGLIGNFLSQVEKDDITKKYGNGFRDVTEYIVNTDDDLTWIMNIKTATEELRIMLFYIQEKLNISNKRFNKLLFQSLIIQDDGFFDRYYFDIRDIYNLYYLGKYKFEVIHLGLGVKGKKKKIINIKTPILSWKIKKNKSPREGFLGLVEEGDSLQFLIKKRNAKIFKKIIKKNEQTGTL